MGKTESHLRLFSDGKFKQVSEFLWVTLKAEPTAEEQIPLPQERANQLELLLRSLHELRLGRDSDNGDSRCWLSGKLGQGIERVLAEIGVRLRARHSLPDWVSAAGQILQLLLKLDGAIESLAHDLTIGEQGRLFRSLSSIAASQMELGPEPAVPRRSLVNVWMVGYRLLKELNSIDQETTGERKLSMESNTNSEASDANDAFGMVPNISTTSVRHLTSRQ